AKKPQTHCRCIYQTSSPFHAIWRDCRAFRYPAGLRNPNFRLGCNSSAAPLRKERYCRPRTIMSKPSTGTKKPQKSRFEFSAGGIVQDGERLLMVKVENL